MIRCTEKKLIIIILIITILFSFKSSLELKRLIDKYYQQSIIQIHLESGNNLISNKNDSNHNFKEENIDLNFKICEQCSIFDHTDYWGDALIWGYGHKKETIQECYEECLNYQPLDKNSKKCNVWVYCGHESKCQEDYKDCWIKYLEEPEKSNPRIGLNVPHISGLIGTNKIKEEITKRDPAISKYHVVITASGLTAQWESRICYYWYKKQKEKCEKMEICDIGGFTRILHSGEKDDLMHEIPTFIAQPLPHNITKENINNYIVLNRPYAFVQWFKNIKIKENFILMIEPDYIFLRPMPNLMKNIHKFVSFPYFYINPTYEKYDEIINYIIGYNLTKDEIKKIPTIGNSPTLILKDDLSQIVPIWLKMALKIYDNNEARKTWGWVQEMYAFAIACYLTNNTDVEYHREMIAEPPYIETLEYMPDISYYMIHYTYGNDYDLDGKKIFGRFGDWHFDKRDYSVFPPKKYIVKPPKNVKNELLDVFLDMLMDAMQNIPCWDEYSNNNIIINDC